MKSKNILFIVGGVVLVVVIGLLVFFANKPKNTTSSSDKTYTLHAAVKNSAKPLNELDLPQLSTTVAADEAEVQVQTTAGNIDIKLFPKLAPNAVQNFLVLAKDDYYKDNQFFRVIKQFMIQGGDNTNTGTGGKSIFGQNFATEISNQLYNIRGALSLANTGQANSSSSQFFIVQNSQDQSKSLSTSKYPQKIIDAYKHGGAPTLDGSYTVFGQVISGMDVVDKIATAPVTSNSQGEQSKPEKPESITGVKILKNYDFGKN